MNDLNDLKKSVYARLEILANAEKVTRQELMCIADEMLVYVPMSDDIDSVNRLLGVLTPANRAVAILFFGHYLPWTQEKDEKGNFTRFGKRLKGAKQIAKKQEAIAEFLSNEDMTFWNWVDDNVEVKKKNFAASISGAVKKALKGDDKSDTPALSARQIIDAVLDGGVSMMDIVDMVSATAEEMKAQQQAMFNTLNAANDEPEVEDSVEEAEGPVEVAA